MLRPSRPMMRPFMSSADSWTTETVVSAAWPAARRCMQTDRMLRTRRSASRLVSSSIWRMRRAASCLAWSSISSSSTCFAFAPDIPARRSSLRSTSLPALGERLALVVELGLAPAKRLLAPRDRVRSSIEPGAALGQSRLQGCRGVAIHARTGRGDGAMRTAVEHRRDHDCDRDERCGTDDCHRRSSRWPRGTGSISSDCYGERPSGPFADANGCHSRRRMSPGLLLAS